MQRKNKNEKENSGRKNAGDDYEAFSVVAETVNDRLLTIQYTILHGLYFEHQQKRGFQWETNKEK